ncbi:MAG: hypothetical protein N4A70_00040 [Pelagimonas sp.]|nr:hypothetical protein [Pelagimonas sp.]
MEQRSPFDALPIGSRPSFASFWPDTRFVEMRSHDGYFARLLNRTPTNDDEHLLMVGGSIVHHERVHWQIAHSLTWGILRSASVSLRTTLASLFFRNLDRDALLQELKKQASGSAPISMDSEFDICISDTWSATTHTVAEHSWILTMLPYAFDYGGINLTRPPDFMLGIMSQYLGGAFDPVEVAFGDDDAVFQSRVRGFRNPKAVEDWSNSTTHEVPAMAVEECLAVSAQLIYLEHIDCKTEDERRLVGHFADNIIDGVFGADAGHYPICFTMAQRVSGLPLADINLRVLGLICELALDPPLPFDLGGDAKDYTLHALHPGVRFRVLLDAALGSRILTINASTSGSDLQNYAEELLKAAGMTRAQHSDVSSWLATYDEDTTQWPSQELGWHHARTALLGRQEIVRMPGVLQDMFLSGGSPEQNDFYDLPFVLLDGEIQLQDPLSEDEARLAGQQVLNAHVSRMTDQLAFRSGPLQPIGLPSNDNELFGVFAERAHEVLEAAFGVPVPKQTFRRAHKT